MCQRFEVVTLNIYDFDHTIYRGDCTLDFWLFCVKRHPSSLRALPRSIISGVRFQFRIIKREEFKEIFYSFLQYVPNVRKEVQEFWNLYMRKCSPWYETLKKENDIIISASPDFLVSVACKRLGVRWIASYVDEKTGELLSANCKGEEKVRRLLKEYPGAKVECFYSDSISDTPLAEIAEQAFRIKRGIVMEWKSN